MRIWEKVYLVVLVLFVLVLNLCGGFIFRTIYAGSVAASENASATVWRTIAVSMAEDLSGLKDDKALFQTYVSYYNNRNRAFELWRDDVLCYKSVSGTQVIYSSGEGKLQSDYRSPWRTEKPQRRKIRTSSACPASWRSRVKSMCAHLENFREHRIHWFSMNRIQGSYRPGTGT